MSWTSHITNAGLTLLRSMLGGSRLTITRAEISSGILTGDEIKGLTELGDKIPAYVQIKKAEGTSAPTVDVQISNYGVTERSEMHQVGLYAALEDGSEILFSVYQNEFGEEIPSAAEFPDLKLTFHAGLDVSVTDNITVVINHSAFITWDELAESISGSVEISSRQTPAVGVKTHYYAIAECSYTPQQSGIPSTPDVPDAPEVVADGYLQEESGEVARASISGDDGISPLALKSD